MSTVICHGNGIHTVDACYLRPKMASVHIVNEAGHVALVDTGTNDSLPGLLHSLADLGLSSAQVEYILLTHIHLDHAGGAGAMMRQFPNARLVVHPRGVRHMIDPSRLIEGATAVYGAAEMARIYGEILPVDPERIIEATEGLSVVVGGRSLRILDTPGHARHHVCFLDEKTGHVFTGDTLGISYPDFDVAGRQFVFPGTTPVQFNPAEMHASIDRVIGLRPGAAYLTHFGRLNDVGHTGEELHRLIDAFVAIALQYRDAGTFRHQRICDALANLMVKEVAALGCALPAENVLALLAHDIEINAQGLEVWLDSTLPH